MTFFIINQKYILSEYIQAKLRFIHVYNKKKENLCSLTKSRTGCNSHHLY